MSIIICTTLVCVLIGLTIPTLVAFYTCNNTNEKIKKKFCHYVQNEKKINNEIFANYGITIEVANYNINMYSVYYR